MTQLCRCFVALVSVALLLELLQIPAMADDGTGVSSPRDGSYAGLLIGAGRSSNYITDTKGWSNWGNPGWTLGYNDKGVAGGVFFGRRVENGSFNLRYEFEAMLTDLSARSNRVDPRPTYGGDETVITKYDWAVALRFGAEKQVDDIRYFILGGPALARIFNSVTDLDYYTDENDPLYGQQFVDSDDSFDSDSTRLGWTLGIGFEKDVAPNLSFRLEGVVFDFGSETYRVNYSGNNSCGNGGPKAPCDTFLIDHRLSALRLGFVYHFSP